MNWHNYYMNIAEAVSLKSKDKKKVGSCLVSKDNRIISTGYNGLKANSNDNIDWGNRKLVHDLVIHAEMNCLLYSNSKYEDAILYCTLSPCTTCIKLIACSNIKKIYYKERYKDIDIVENVCKFYEIELNKL